MEINKLRREIIKAVSDADADVLKQWLGSAGQGWAANAAESVHCLQFEKTDNAGLDKKRNMNRESFLLSYSDKDTDAISLVKKSRRKDCSLERRALISKSECERIIAGDHECLNGAVDPLLFEFYSHLSRGDLRPQVLVDFRRETFSCLGDDVQVALESDFYTGSNTSDFMNDRHPTIKRTGPVILKVKYDRFLPEILSRFACGGKPAGKYAFAYAYPGI